MRNAEIEKVLIAVSELAKETARQLEAIQTAGSLTAKGFGRDVEADFLQENASAIESMPSILKPSGKRGLKAFAPWLRAS
jgi:hypothetical protein